MTNQIDTNKKTEDLKNLLEQEIVTPAKEVKEVKKVKRHLPKPPFTLQAFEVKNEGKKDEQQILSNTYYVSEIMDIDGDQYIYNAMNDHRNDKKSFTEESGDKYILFPVECASNPVTVKFQRVQREFSPLPANKGLIRVHNEGKKSTTYYFKLVK